MTERWHCRVCMNEPCEHATRVLNELEAEVARLKAELVRSIGEVMALREKLSEELRAAGEEVEGLKAELAQCQYAAATGLLGRNELREENAALKASLESAREALRRIRRAPEMDGTTAETLQDIDAIAEKALASREKE